MPDVSGHLTIHFQYMAQVPVAQEFPKLLKTFRVMVLVPGLCQLVKDRDKMSVITTVRLKVRITICFHDRFFPPEMMARVVTQFCDDLIKV